jgi:hypothetical protein
VLFRLSGEPLVESLETKKKYLSFLYDTGSTQLLPELRLLGVKEMTYDDFFSELKAMITRRPGFLGSQSQAWHSRVAEILQRSRSTWELSTIPIVPVRDGRWVCPTEHHLFLQTGSDGASVPNGIDICIVESDACLNNSRRNFFQWLGIQPCSREKVCQMIVERHTNARTLDLNDIVADINYLFETPPSMFRNSVDSIWAMDRNERFAHGNDLYIDDPRETFAVSDHADNLSSGIRMIHPRYLEKARAEGKQTELIKWLKDRLEVSTLPCLLRDRQLTEEFTYFTTNASSELLLILRDNWSHYNLQIHGLITIGRGSRTTVVKQLSEMPVRCTDGSMHQLGQAVLPLDELRSVADLLPFLDVRVPSDRRWLQLEALGLTVKETFDLHLRQLKALALADPASHPATLSAVCNIYEQLAARSRERSQSEILK